MSEIMGIDQLVPGSFNDFAAGWNSIPHLWLLNTDPSSYKNQASDHCQQIGVGQKKGPG